MNYCVFRNHLHFVGTAGQHLLYVDNRLKHRKTFMEWDRIILGPIIDELDFEQGDISSGNLYTIYNSEQLTAAHEANLGINVGPVQVSSLGQADNVVLLSHDIFFLSHLLGLTLDYCRKHHLTLAPEKTKIMVFSAPRHKELVSYQKAVSPIEIDNIPIKFVTTAEHVGITRSVDGNLPHIRGRISAHMRALFSVLPAGLTRNLNANPAVFPRVQSIYSQPVLLSSEELPPEPYETPQEHPRALHLLHGRILVCNRQHSHKTALLIRHDHPPARQYPSCLCTLQARF